MNAWLNLRYITGTRADIFLKGLKRLGYKVIPGVPTQFDSGDLFVTWNRLSLADRIAKSMIKAGNPVIVAENATWGNDFAGRRWYHLAKEHHNTAGKFPIGENDRWDSLDIDLDQFRKSGETVILPQRGIGSHPVAMPKTWFRMVKNKHPGRIRKHPGKRHAIPLKDDLSKCGRVVTWGSGAAVKALMWGIPVVSYMPNWIAEQDNTEEGRLAMFRRLAWAQWTHKEIESGEAFDRLR